MVASGAAAIGVYKLAERLFASGSSSNKGDGSSGKVQRAAREPSKIYEEQKLVDEYMLFNYSSENEMILFDLGKYSNIKNCLDFPKKVALLCRDHCPEIFFSNVCWSHPLRLVWRHLTW